MGKGENEGKAEGVGRDMERETGFGEEGRGGGGDMRTQCRDKQLGRTKGERTHHGRIRITKG